MAEIVLKARKTLIVRIPEKLAIFGARVTYLEKGDIIDIISNSVQSKPRPPV
jgi:hypothetical protein